LQANADSVISSYLSGTTTSLTDLDAQPMLKKVFIDLNTALPASAACERMFSVAGRVFAPNRSTMSDDHFEQQLLLRLNRSKLSE
jgi:hypothetical protein